MSHKYGIFVPFNYMNFKISAHFIEINKIYHLEMMKKVILSISCYNIIILFLVLHC